MRQPIRYPIGSISSGTMRLEDLIPCFTSELSSLARRPGIVPAKRRKEHAKLVREIEARIPDEREFEDIDLGIEGMDDSDLEQLFDALGEYSGPYFYFGAHPGDGADYGWFLSQESLEEDIHDGVVFVEDDCDRHGYQDAPRKYRGLVLHVSDHGNMTLYRQTSRARHEIWGIV